MVSIGTQWHALNLSGGCQRWAVNVGTECWEWWALEPSAESGGHQSWVEHSSRCWSQVEHSGWVLELSITAIFTATAWIWLQSWMLLSGLVGAMGKISAGGKWWHQRLAEGMESAPWNPEKEISKIEEKSNQPAVIVTTGGSGMGNL